MALEKLGPYRFHGVLGRGGMGTVYKGQHETTGEFHAVKVLAPTYSDDDHFRGRFESEIKALLKMDHPNIVRLLSFGQEDGVLFFAMELVEGNSLFYAQRKGYRFHWREILSIATDVASGLRHAHDRGVIHRDLKPGNLLKMHNGVIKITDLGIAKRFGTSQNTGDNVVGTMDFMSPEQARGKPVTVRSDLYSLGTVLYTLLSGKPPFSGNSIEESLRNVTSVPAPKIRSVVPDVPPELEKLIAKLMAKRPENRVATAQALLYKLEDLKELLKEESEAITRQHPQPGQAADTFELASSIDDGSLIDEAPTGHDRSDPTHAEALGKTGSSNPTVGDTVDESEFSSRGGVGTREDYFAEVSDQQRGDKLETDTGPSLNRLWPLLLGLALVVGLTIFGLWSTHRAPPADSLYETIEASSRRPQLALKESAQYLELYPDDNRVRRVELLHEIGTSVQFYKQLINRLSVRSNISGGDRLTRIERQFLDITTLSETNMREANAKMLAFVTVHENDPGLSERDQDCLEAAAGFRYYIFQQVVGSAEDRLSSIMAAMAAAEIMEDEEKAAAVYASIIELYDDDESIMTPPIAELIEEAKARLEKINEVEGS